MIISEWAKILIFNYFNLRPYDETQKMYKRMGYKIFEYWYYELNFIMNKSWIIEEDNHDYLLKKYKVNENKISSCIMDSKDRDELVKAFCNYIGVYRNSFPFGEEDFR